MAKVNIFCLALHSVLVSSFLLFFLIDSFQTWRKHKEGDPWPRKRWYHIATCLGYGGLHQRLLISGGEGGGVTYDDMWLMDPQSGRMEKVRINLPFFLVK